MNNITPVIFYADDDRDDLELFEMAAFSLKVNIRLFSYAAEMLDEIKELPEKPSIIFVDLNMPMISGYEVITILKENNINIPVVVLSTTQHPVSIAQAKDAGASYYITKPTSITKLQKAIDYVLGIDWDSFKPTMEEFAHQF
jgi:CheY-like chemotaxis protein